MKEIKLSKIETIGDGSCFFHSLFTIFLNYRNMSLAEKKNYVYRFREAMANRLSFDSFCSLPTFEPLVKHLDDKMPVYTEFITRLSSPSEWACNYIISYTAHVLNLNIIVFDNSARIILDEKKNDVSATVFMILVDDSHFELLMNKDGEQYIF